MWVVAPDQLLTMSGKLCMGLMIPFDVFGLIAIDITRLITLDDTPELKSLGQVKEIMVKYFPDAQHFTESTIKDFLKALAKSWQPDLQPYLDKLLADKL